MKLVTRANKKGITATKLVMIASLEFSRLFLENKAENKNSGTLKGLTLSSSLPVRRFIEPGKQPSSGSAVDRVNDKVTTVTLRRMCADG